MYPLVSYICPTFNRPERHESLYRCFARSRYPNKELLVGDDSATHSVFFPVADPRVRYYHSPVRMSIGAKRNRLISLAHGEVILHQDDDDWYSPDYTQEMVNRLRDAELVKLSVFNILHERDGSRWEWDTRKSGGSQTLLSSKYRGLCLMIPFGLAITDVTLWGFGFSYVYRKCLWDRAKFPDINLREDYGFIQAARRAGARLKQVDDCADLVLHSVHGESTSTSFPQRRLDGPTPIPVTTFAVNSALGATFGSVLMWPYGAVVGGVVGAMITKRIVKNAIAH